MATTTIAATKTANSLGTLQNGDMILGERVSGTGGVYTIATSGTGDMVLNTSPTLITPLLGTPTSGVLTNCTGLPVSTGIAGLASGMATFLTTPSSANFAATLTDETGSGAAVFATSPTLVTPLLGTPTSGVLTNCTGLPIGGGGTGVTSVTTVPAASSFAGWDANKNLSADSFIANYATTNTAAGTTTLTVDSVQQQYFTGATTQTVVMPDTSTLVRGQTFRIVNNSTGTVTIQSSGANTIIAAIANSEVILTCILTSGTTAASWQYQVQATDAASTGTGAPVRATSPTFVTPALGTPASGVLTNCTGLPLAGGGTGSALTDPNADRIMFWDDSAGAVDWLTAGSGLSISGTTITNTGSSKVVQRVYTSTAAVATGTTTVPLDDTIPQNTEGTEFITLAVTPSNASNILEIRVTAFVSASTLCTPIGALFQDSTAGALSATGFTTHAAGYISPLNLVYTMVAGTTSATTFKFRIGPNVAATVTLNGVSGARDFGGVCSTTMSITEYLP